MKEFIFRRDIPESLPESDPDGVKLKIIRSKVFNDDFKILLQDALKNSCLVLVPSNPNGLLDKVREIHTLNYINYAILELNIANEFDILSSSNYSPDHVSFYNQLTGFDIVVLDCTNLIGARFNVINEYIQQHTKARSVRFYSVVYNPNSSFKSDKFSYKTDAVPVFPWHTNEFLPISDYSVFLDLFARNIVPTNGNGTTLSLNQVYSKVLQYGFSGSDLPAIDDLVFLRALHKKIQERYLKLYKNNIELSTLKYIWRGFIYPIS